MKFIHQKPFRTDQGDVITMKALVTIRGKQHVECYENKKKYRTDQLTEMSPEEYQEYLNNDFE